MPPTLVSPPGPAPAANPAPPSPPVSPAGTLLPPRGAGRVAGNVRADQPAGRAAEPRHVRPAAHARPGDDVGLAVATHVANRRVHPAAEARIVGEEGADQLPVGPAVDADRRP